MKKVLMHELRKISGNFVERSVKCTLALRGWLDRNKIWFETVAAISLTAVSVLVSVLQLNSARRQETLIEIQTKVAEAQHVRLEKEDAQIRQEALRDLRLIRRDLLLRIRPLTTHVVCPDDFSSVGTNMTFREKANWLDEIGPIWDRMGSNRLVLDTTGLFDAYMKCDSDFQMFGNLHNIMPGGGNMLATIPSSFSKIVKNMDFAMVRINEYCATPLLPIQDVWVTSQREAAIKEGRIRVNSDGSTTVLFTGKQE
jgi:hypothetical protein